MIALIHIKKTAGKTLKHIMRCEFGVAHCDVKRWRGKGDVFDAADLRRLKRINPRLASIAGHSVRSTSDLDAAEPDLRFYTFLRDAEKRCISEYQYSVAQGRWPEGSFDRWVTDARYRNVQTQSLAGCEDADAAIDQIERRIAFVGLMEHFDESLALMQAHLDLPRFTPLLRRVNAARDNRLRDALLADERAMTHVRGANREDARVLDYVRREVYPRQQRQANRVSAGASGAASAGAAGRQFNARFFANGLHRYMVYKPAVAAYRLFASR
ncbi:hypothetical protein [Salinisphaera sp.]|uniref:hypothetical protein n=1 Tax=Salinisphaera sp. TaxID=1914330 RepID=UPI002D79EB6D|nr:hypothetical protein [Salinisphaera sp.]HET7312996.1 hypothetical protein [Salinisphaera sp.]